MIDKKSSACELTMAGYLQMDRSTARRTGNVVAFPKDFRPAKLDGATALSCLRSAINDLEDVYRRYGQNGLEDRHRSALERALAMTSYVRNRM